jgi:hypothetical protein
MKDTSDVIPTDTFHKPLSSLGKNLVNNLLVHPFVLGKNIDVESRECFYMLGTRGYEVGKRVVEKRAVRGWDTQKQGVCHGSELGDSSMGPIQRVSGS